MNVLNVRPSLGCIDTAWTEHIQCDSLNEIIYTVKGNYLKYCFLWFVFLLFPNISCTKNGA